MRASEATVFIPGTLHPAAEVYANQTFGRIVRVGEDGLDWDACLAVCDGIVLRVADITRGDIGKAPRLKYICRTGTGCDMIDLEAAKKYGVAVGNNPGANSQAVAELALALILCLLRRVKELHVNIEHGKTVSSIDALSSGLYGRTVGLIGMGDTAYALATLLRCFDVRILVYSRSRKKRWDGSDSKYPKAIPHERVDDLENLLKSVDVLSLHCPISPETRDMIDGKRLSVMRKGAVIINTARGGIIDESALFHSLSTGHLGGAGLDVFATEPIVTPELQRLAQLPNVLCLPHVGGSTESVVKSACKTTIDNLRDALNGGVLKNRVV